MKNKITHYSCLAIFTLLSISTQAQWDDSFSGTVWTNDNVGINTASAQEDLHVFGDIALSGFNSGTATLSFRDAAQVPSVSTLGSIGYSNSGGGLLKVRSITDMGINSGNNANNTLALSGGGEVTISLSNLTNPNNNKIRFFNGLTERARIEGTGKLVMTSTSDNPIQIINDNDNNYTAWWNESGYVGYAGAFLGQTDMDFGTGGTNSTGKTNIVTRATARLTVDSGGNVGIGTTSPAFKLQVNGNTDIIGELTASSDIRLKNKIVKIDNAIEKVINLNPVFYNFKTASFPDMNLPSRRKMGFLAQEVETVLPALVSSGTEAVDVDGESFDSKSVNYIEIIPLLTKAIQEQQVEIQLLKGEIKSLKSKL